VTKSERTWDHLVEDTVEDIHRGRLNQESGHLSVSGVGNQERPREEDCLALCHMTVGNVHASCKANARRWKDAYSFERTICAESFEAIVQVLYNHWVFHGDNLSRRDFEDRS
jgi:hypothetical protein